MFVAIAAVFALGLAQDSTPVAGVDIEGTRVLTQEERAAAEEDARRNEIVCRRERFTGSNRSTRVCLTRGEWEGMREAAQETQRAIGEGPRERVDRSPDEG